MNPFLTQKSKSTNPFIGISGKNIEESQDTVTDSIWSQIASGGKSLVSDIFGGGKSLVGGIAAGVGGLGLTAVDYLGKKAVNTFGTEQMKQNIAGAPTLQEQFGEKFGQKENPALYGTGQVLGEIATLSTPVSTIGKGTQIAAKTLGAGEKTAKLAQAGAEGLAFTKGMELSEQKPQTLEDYAINTGLNIAIPGAGMALKSIGERAPERIIDSLIKPLLKDFAYGKEPGKTVAQLGITANTFDDLISKIKTKKDEIGNSIGSIISRSESPQPVDLVQTLKPIDEAITKASFTPRVNASLLQRLDNVKADLQEIAQRGETLQNAQEFKGLIGDMTKWTGNATDDAIVNKALKNVYRSVRNSMDDILSKTLTPEEFASYKTATKQYGDLMSAENAAVYRDKLTQRQDLVSFGARNAGLLSALATAVGTGGASIPTLLAGLAGMGIEKGLATPAFKTRLASLLSKLAPKEVSTFFEKVPTAKQLFKDEEIKNFVETPKGGLSTQPVDNAGIPFIKVKGQTIANIKPTELDAMRRIANNEWTVADMNILVNKLEANNVKNAFDIPASEMKDIAEKLVNNYTKNVISPKVAKDVAEQAKMLDEALAGKKPSEVAQLLKNKTPEEIIDEYYAGKSSPAVGQTADLLAEAKKYKTEEEFVKAQGGLSYRGGSELSKDKITNSGISVSKSKNIAEDFVKNKGGKIEEIVISPNAKIINYSEIPDIKFKNLNDYSPELDTDNKQIWRDIEVEYQKAIDWAKSNGYDGVKLPLEGEIRIINTNKIKTRAQLSAIWKQAHNK